MGDGKTVARRSTRNIEAHEELQPRLEKIPSADSAASRRRNMEAEREGEKRTEKEFSRHSRTSSSSTVSGKPFEMMMDNMGLNLDGTVMDGTNDVHCHIEKVQTGRDMNDSRTELNFGIVVPDLYRSACPEPSDHEYLKSLGLKTILSLADKERPDAYGAFIEQNGIRHIVVDMAGTKKVAIPLPIMKTILGIVMDTSNYPMLIHCNHGKHRTGSVVAILRKVTGAMGLDSILHEYKRYAGEKARDCDLAYITAFGPSDIEEVLESTRYLKTTQHNDHMLETSPLLTNKMAKLVYVAIIALLFLYINLVWF